VALLFFTRRRMVRLTGRQPARMIEPLEMSARAPGLLRASGRPEHATAKLHRVDKCFKALAALKANTLTHREYRIDLGSQIARREA
jgi:hypothetical protein